MISQTIILIIILIKLRKFSYPFLHEDLFVIEIFKRLIVLLKILNSSSDNIGIISFY
jgi:hypothetical protein